MGRRWGELGCWSGVGEKGRKLYLNNNFLKSRYTEQSLVAIHWFSECLLSTYCGRHCARGWEAEVGPSPCSLAFTGARGHLNLTKGEAVVRTGS